MRVAAGAALLAEDPRAALPQVRHCLYRIALRRCFGDNEAEDSEYWLVFGSDHTKKYCRC